MKYLVHIKPSEEFSEKLMMYRSQITDSITKISSNGLHCTLMSIRIKESDELRAIQSLEQISMQQFYVQSDAVDIFDNNSLVIKLQRSSDLLELHKKIIDGLQNFIDWEETPKPLHEYLNNPERLHIHNTYGSLYCAEFYNPHITIAQFDEILLKNISLSKNDFIRFGWNVNNFFLSKKQSKWEVVRKFSLMNKTHEST